MKKDSSRNLTGKRQFKKIVVTHDGSKLASSVIGPVVELAIAFDAEIVLLQVIDTLLQIRSRSIPPTPYMNLQSSLVVEQIAKDERKMAERNLSVLKKTLEKSGLLKVETKIVEGFASEEITAFSKKVNADLIVMATHGRSGLGRVVIGSVAESVLRHSPCPVLLIRPHAK